MDDSVSPRRAMLTISDCGWRALERMVRRSAENIELMGLRLRSAFSVLSAAAVTDRER